MGEQQSVMDGIRDFFSKDKKDIEYVRMRYTTKGKDRTDLGAVRMLFDLEKAGDYTLDDQSWDDLDMDEVYGRLNGTCSTPGEQVLYSMLRNPLMEEEKLKQRSGLIELFGKNHGLRERLQCIFFRLGRNYHNSFLEMIKDELVKDKMKYILYNFCGKVLPLAIILFSVFTKPKYLLALLLLSFLNTSINMKETKEIKSSGISYLRSIIKSARKIARVKDEQLSAYTDRISFLIDQVHDIEKGLRFIGFETMFGGIFEPVSGALLLQESSYYRISNIINEKKGYLMELYHLIGELEAMIAVSNYQQDLVVKPMKPKFTTDVVLNIVDGVHPLIEKAVANSIHIKDRDIVLTGTNMSGKSTFLRMLGVNMLFAQTFYFVQAKSYEACFFNIVCSISPNDDVTAGKSFFMAEVESIKRIVKALEKDMPVFCPIDEIFRGTNPIERIAMSAEILLYLNRHKTVSIVATHDRELVDILKDKYEFYYFSENVDNTNGLSFDYKLKTGVSQTRNAIKLLQYCGYPDDIVSNSFKRAESIEGFI